MLTSWPAKEEGIVAKGEWAMQTCVGFGLPSLLAVLSIQRPGSCQPTEEIALGHRFVPLWLHGSPRSQEDGRTDEGKVMRSSKTVRFGTPPLCRLFCSFLDFPPQQRASGESMLIQIEMRNWINSLILPFPTPLGKLLILFSFPMIYKVIISCICIELQMSQNSSNTY